MSFISVRRYTILAISALIGLLIALGLLYLVNRAAAVDTVPVVVATRAITTGTTLDESMLTVQQWPAHLKPFFVVVAGGFFEPSRSGRLMLSAAGRREHAGPLHASNIRTR